MNFSHVGITLKINPSWITLPRMKLTRSLPCLVANTRAQAFLEFLLQMWCQTRNVLSNPYCSNFDWHTAHDGTDNPVFLRLEKHLLQHLLLQARNRHWFVPDSNSADLFLFAQKSFYTLLSFCLCIARTKVACASRWENLIKEETNIFWKKNPQKIAVFQQIGISKIN